MATTDTTVKNLTVNKLTYSQWKTEKTNNRLSDTEVYELTDVNTALQEKLTEGTGIDITNNTISNSGVRSVSTGTNNGTISVNTNGTSTEVSVAGLGSSAFVDTTNSVTSAETKTLTSGGAYTNLVRRLSSSAATGSTSQGVYVDANGQVQTCDAVTSTYSGTGTAPVNGTAVKSAIDAAIASVYKPAGSVAFASLPNPAKSLLGNVYDVTDAFTTDSKFVNSGQSYPAGTNVVVINTSGSTYKYDVLAGFVDLSGYQQTSTAVTHTASTAAGSATQPVYVNASGVATPTTYELNKTVPADAVFTDTTYSAFTGADGTAAGTSGLVPAPGATDNNKFLAGDGTWATPTGTTYADMTGATSSAAGAHGLVPAPASGDNTKFLRGDATWATVDALPSQTSQSGKFLTTNGTTASWANVDALPSQTGNSGKYLTTNGTTASWGDTITTTESSLKTVQGNSILGTGDISILPSQTSQSGKFLTTDGSAVSWANVDALPSQTGQSGKFLTTNGSAASWASAPTPAIDSSTINTNSNSQLQAIGVIEKNTGAVKYDWVGTLAQWTAGRSGGTIPDSWICYITDDETTSVSVDWSSLVNVPTYITALGTSGGNVDAGTM